MKEGINPNKQPINMQPEGVQQSHFTIEHWTPKMAHEIYEKLEHPNWAPWLEASEETIAGRATVFPEGQLLLKENGLPVASLSMNKINWDGNPNTLPSWDEVAGNKKTDYSETYKPDGNTLVLMSMNVADDAKGKQLPAKLISHIKQMALDTGVEHIIGSFRPSGYGKAKKEMGYNLKFWDYCQMTVPGTDKPLDPWLRSLWWVGMKLMKEDDRAMFVHCTPKTFHNLMKEYHPESWVKIPPFDIRGEVESWECSEVGSWKVHYMTTGAIYQESNVWGEIPFK